ncbi:DUF305 domain-containing protein [Patescibacteria group bacterium]|nr:DUF305 domain-containing protein [Patescibacteria group bacterium]
MNKTAQLILVAIVALVVGLLIGSKVCSKDQSMATQSIDHSMTSSSAMMQHDMSGMMMATGTMSHAMDSMVGSLKGKTGSDFDKVFLDEMIVHHEGAIEMAKLALTSSERAALKTLANEIITAQTKEIQQMKAWRASWFSN